MDDRLVPAPILPEEDSIPHLKQRVEFARTEEDLIELNFALGALGRALLLQHSTLEGLTCFNEAVIIAQQLGDPEAEVRHLGNQGIALAQIGNFGQALRSLRKSYSIAQRIENTPLIYEALIQIAELEIERKNLEGALASLEEALQVAEEKGSLKPQLKVHLSLGKVYSRLEEFDSALAQYQTALHLATTLHDISAQVECLHNLSAIAKFSGDPALSIVYIQKALAIHPEEEDPERILALSAQFGDALLDSGDFTQAAENYEKALELARAVRDRPTEARLLGSLSIARAELGDLDQSKELADRAVEIAREVDNVQLLGEQLLLKAFAYYEHGQLQAAFSDCLEAIRIFEKIEASSFLDRAMDLLEQIQSEQ